MTNQSTQEKAPLKRFLPNFRNVPESRKKAVFVGINYFNKPFELRGCVNDAKRMKQFLIDNYGYEDNTRSTVLLTDEPETPQNFQPTRANIIRALQWLVKDAKSGDFLFLHFSGHGTPIADKNGDEDDGFDEAIVPVDYSNEASMIIDDELFQTLVQPLPKGCRLTAVFDCCHSGSVLDLPYMYRPNGKVFHNTNSAWEHGGANSNCNWKSIFCCGGGRTRSEAHVIMLSGCKDREYSVDLSVGDVAGGALTGSLIEFLVEDPNISCEALISKLRSALKKYLQQPELSALVPFDPQCVFDF